MAWEELDAFSYTYDVKELQDRLKSIYYSVNSIKSEVLSLKNKPSTTILNKILENISHIEELAASPSIQFSSDTHEK